MTAKVNPRPVTVEVSTMLGTKSVTLTCRPDLHTRSVVVSAVSSAINLSGPILPNEARAYAALLVSAADEVEGKG